MPKGSSFGPEDFRITDRWEANGTIEPMIFRTSPDGRGFDRSRTRVCWMVHGREPRHMQVLERQGYEFIKSHADTLASYSTRKIFFRHTWIHHYTHYTSPSTEMLETGNETVSDMLKCCEALLAPLKWIAAENKRITTEQERNISVKNVIELTANARETIIITWTTKKDLSRSISLVGQ